MLMPQCFFFPQFYLVEKMLQAMVKKTMDHVLSNLAFAIVVFVNFDL
jgi:hypothetical protein